MEQKNLTKEELYEMLPCIKPKLERELEKRVEIRNKCFEHTEWSQLESAILFEDKNEGFPNPDICVYQHEYENVTYMTNVEFVNKNGEVIRTLKEGYFKKHDRDMFPESVEGEITDKVLNLTSIKPDFIVVKKIKILETDGKCSGKKTEYNINIYKIK